VAVSFGHRCGSAYSKHIIYEEQIDNKNKGSKPNIDQKNADRER